MALWKPGRWDRDGPARLGCSAGRQAMYNPCRKGSATRRVHPAGAFHRPGANGASELPRPPEDPNDEQARVTLEEAGTGEPAVRGQLMAKHSGSGRSPCAAFAVYLERDTPGAGVDLQILNRHF